MSTVQNNLYLSSVIDYMDELEGKLDTNLPDRQVQIECDRVAAKLKTEFAPFYESLTKFLEQNGGENWDEHLLISLGKLPIRSALNIMTSLYTVLSAAAYTAVHPLKGMSQLVKSTIILLNELTKPEVWSKIGTGAVGMIAAQSFVMGTPLFTIGLVIAGALSVGGVSLDAFIAGVNSEKGEEADAIKEKLGAYFQKLPETVLTGFMSGFLYYGLQKVMKQYPILKNHEFRKIADVAQYGGPEADWSKMIKTVQNVTLEEAQKIASSDPNITFFFYNKQGMWLAPDKVFGTNEAVFFSGEPWWGSAPGLADGYIKI